MGLTAGALMCGYGLALTMAEQIWGRPSSTSALGFFMAPIAGLIVGIGAFAVGMAAHVVLRRRGVVSRPAPSWVTPMLWMVVLAGSAAFLMIGRSLVLESEFTRRPHVVLDSTRIHVVSPPTATLEDRVTAPELYAGITNTTDAHPINWNDIPVKVTSLAEQVVVSDPNGRTLASADLHDFDGITRMHAAPVCRQSDGKSLLAVLVSLRATGRRAMLLLFAADGQLIYQDHLERSGGAKDALYTGRLNGAEALAVSLGPVSTWTCAQ